VKAVDEGSVLKGWHAFIEIAAHAEIAVGHGEDGFRLSQKTGIKLLLNHFPLIDRVDVVRGINTFCSDHRPFASLENLFVVPVSGGGEAGSVSISTEYDSGFKGIPANLQQQYRRLWAPGFRCPPGGQTR
jgi:hypothetical protein